MALKLTPRQSQILQLIRQAVADDGRPPTRAEIARQLGFRSANAAEDHLRALARKGAIRLAAGTSRGIQLIDAGAGDVASASPPGQTEGWAAGPSARPTILAGVAPAPQLTPAAGHLLLPIIGRVAAGHPILAAEHIEREIPVGAGLFAQPPDYLLRVRGASMRDAGILDGDLLAVRRSVEARNGQIVVARLGDDVTVKRLDRQGGHLRLLPENPDFDPIRIGPGDDFALEGIAVGLIRTHGLQ